MLIWVAALHCEAKPIIDFYRLKKTPSEAGFDLYRGDESLCIVSGMGKLASAAACAWIGARQRESASLAWINLGCAGGAGRAIGSAFTLDKIVDADSGQSWFPAPVSKTFLPPAACLSLARPGEDYREDFLFDMEASGFICSALRFSSAELVQAIKIVSDNPEYRTGNDRAAVSALIERHIDAIDRQAAALQELNREVGARAVDSDEWRRLNDLAHFSQTQQNRLQTLWRYLRNREHDADELLEELSLLPSDSAILDSLQQTCQRDSEFL